MDNDEVKQPIDQQVELSKLHDGFGVIVDGVIVAWFANSNSKEAIEDAIEWCRYHHFGKWLTWNAKSPELIPLTEQEKLKAEAFVKEMQDFLSGQDDIIDGEQS